MKKFIALYDSHFGFERDVYRHKKAIHDQKAINVALQFMEDFKPDEIILGGDMLDCGCISPHNRKNGAGRTEGLRLLSDAKGLRQNLLLPVEASGAALRYITGNHEAWLSQLVDHDPGLEGIIDLRSILELGEQWKVIPQGHSTRLGKLTFIHGDQYKGGGEYVAKRAVTDYESSVRMGHFHTSSTYTKSSASDMRDNHTGIVVPCLSTKGPQWLRGSPNRWCQGFLFGYVRPDGSFHDYPVVIVHGKAIINGQEYVG